MLVSIMIPTYNQEKYISDAIQSALSQTYENLEIIVCDDNSIDNTYKILKKYNDKRLKIFKNNKNLGRVKNYRHILYDLANGEYVINLDGDDYFLDNEYIQKCVDLIKKNNLDLVFSNQVIRYVDFDKKTDMKLDKIIDGNWLFLNYGKNGLHIPHMTALYNRKKALSLDFYSKDIISSDWESLLKFIINSKIGFVHEPSGAWRQIENSESKIQDIDKVFKNIALVDSVCEYAKDFFSQEKLQRFSSRIRINLLKDISMINIACNFFGIVKFSYSRLSLFEFLKFILNYRFLAKAIIGKIKFKCVE